MPDPEGNGGTTEGGTTGTGTQGGGTTGGTPGGDGGTTGQEDVTGLKNALETERTQRKEFERQLTTLKREASELGTLRTELQTLQARAEKAEADLNATRVEVDFRTAAAKAEAGVLDIDVAFKLAKIDGLLGEYKDGKVSGHNFEALKKAYPTLFTQTSAGGGDGARGRGSTPKTGKDMNSWLRGEG